MSRPRCPIGSRRVGAKCVEKGKLDDGLSEIIYPDVRDFTEHYRRGEWAEAKKARMRIEKKAGVSKVTPAYPTMDELACPRALAKEISCAAKMIKSGRGKGYQAQAVCRSSVGRTQCRICKNIPCKKK